MNTLLLAVLMTPMRAERLLCNYLSRPLAVTETPRFSWWVEDDREGAKQTAYRIQVRKPSGDVLWDSGFAASSQSSLIPYEGPKLAESSGFEWRVQLKDGANAEGPWSSWEPFGTGFTKWPANWIQANVEVPMPQTPHNGYHATMENSADVEKWVEIDLGEVRTVDAIRFHPSRPFDFGRDVTGFCFPLRYRVELDGKVIYEQKEDLPMQTKAYEFKVPPSQGRKLRVVFTKLRERDGGVFGVTLAELEAMEDGHNVALNKPVTAKDSVQHNSWSTKFLTNGDKESHPARNLESLPATEFKKGFSSRSKVARATLYATALGAYEAYINGKKVGNEILAPGWTDYHTRVRYQAHDVTSLVKSGDNEIRALLGDGWYAGRLGMAQALSDNNFPRAIYGRQTSFSAVLKLEYADGTEGWVRTDPTWESATDGPIRSSDIYDGEVYDSRRTSTAWKPSRVSTTDAIVEPQSDHPIEITQRIKPKISDGKGGKLLDFGQNMVGFIRVKLEGPAGAEVKLRHAEMLNEDGTIYTTNLRGAPCVDTITLNGKPLDYRPHFTYHGFRYGFVELPEGAKLVEAEGLVFHTAAPETAAAETSNPMVNRLFQNILWTQRANLMSTPTDCPQRDERLGWSGDLEAYGHTANLFMDLSAFNRKWLTDMRDGQADDGRYPDFAPHPYNKNRHFTGVPGWGDAGVGVAWHNYLLTGDKVQLTEHLDSMKRWLDWIESKNPTYLWVNARHNDYGDWLNGDTLIRDGWPRTGGELPKDVFGTLMWHFSLGQTADLATVLGKNELASDLKARQAKVADAFAKSYIDADGKIKGDTQAGYAFALHDGILAESARPKAFEHLVAAVERSGRKMTTGFHTTHRLMNVLTQYGRNDLAYVILENRDFPSWGYTIDNGATTIWERWDGYVKGRGFQDPGMNSFNHWALGAVGEWMVQSMLGIQPGKPGWSEFKLMPRPGGSLTFAKGHYDSPVGRIESDWKVEGDEVVWNFVVPANTKAMVDVPGTKKTFEAGRYTLRFKK